MNLDGYLAVDCRARNLFQNRRALIGRGLQKGGKSALRQEHRPREAFKVHPRGLLDELGYLVHLIFQNLTRVGVGNFMFCLLQLAVRLSSGAALAPVAAIPSFLSFKGHLGKAFASLTRHDLIAAFSHPIQSRRPTIKPQTDGVEDRRFSRARRAGNGKDSVGHISRMGKIDLPFAG